MSTGARSIVVARERVRGERIGLVSALVGIGIAAGIALRVWILLSSQGALDGDEGVWGLMAKHVLDGDLSFFYWGQAYGGTQEVLLTAPLVWLFGLSAATIRVVPIALWALSALLVWRIGRRVLDEPRARLAAVLFWIWPTYFLWKSTRAHGFYGSSLVLGLCVLLLALRLRERDSRRDLVLLGLAAGCGWWASPQIIVLVIPSLLWLVVRRPAVVRGWWLAVGGGIVGALPWLVANVVHPLYSLHLGANEGSRLGHLHNLGSATLPTGLGLRLPFSLAWVGGAAFGTLVYVALLAGFVWLLVRRRTRARLEPLLLTAVLFPLFYFLSPYAWLNTEPRYLSLLSPVVALLIGRALVPGWRATTVLAVALAFSVAGIALMERDDLAASHAERAAIPADIGPLLQTLRADGVDYCFANYWVAWRVTFETDERIICAATSEVDPHIRPGDGRVYPGDTKFNRYPQYHRRATASGDAAHIVMTRGDVIRRVEPVFRAAHYRRVTVGPFTVFLPPA